MEKQEDKRVWEKFKFPVSVAILLFLFICGISKLAHLIPDTLYIDENEAAAYRLLNQKPWITSSEDIEVSSGDCYTVTCKLWNIFPLKTVTISQADAGEVAVSGQHTGVYVQMDGILVVNTEELTTIDGERINPAKGHLKKGDYIRTLNGVKVETKEELIDQVKASQGETIKIGFIRDGHPQETSITPVCISDDTYKIGIWVRDNAQGIGTITYIKQDGTYGALGHGISDSDTGEVIGIRSGDLYTSEIVGIQKGVLGNPGELQGVIHYKEEEHRGTIEANTECGIFGHIDDESLSKMQKTWYPVAFKQEMHEGKATVICTMDNETEEYEIEIKDIYWSPTVINKCFSIQVTDRKMLEKTGGIIQGLSGSPILQDGKIVGAVTHVLINDPTRGYGIFIENMLEH